MQRLISSLLILIGVSQFFSMSAEACPSSDLGPMIRVPGHIEQCLNYIGAKGLLEQKRTDVQISKWSSPKNNPAFLSKFKFLDEYDHVAIYEHQIMCEYSTYSAIGFRERSGKRNCQISYEGFWPPLIKNSLQKNKKMVSYNYEEVTSEEGITKITTKGFCDPNLKNLSIVGVQTQIPQTPRVDDENYYAYERRRERSLQHITISNEHCDTSTE